MNGGARLRLRVQLTRMGKMRFLSHTEYWRTFMLAARRSGLPLACTGDYRPRLKISLSPPLPIGVTSGCELVDLTLTSYVPPAEAARMLGEALPHGMEVAACRLVADDAKPVGKVIDTAEYVAVITSGATRAPEWSRAAETFLQEDSVEFERVQPRRTRVVDLRPGVHGIEVSETGETGSVRIAMRVDDGTRGTVKPREVLSVLRDYAGAEAGVAECAVIHRESLLTRRGERFISPMEVDRRKPVARGRRERWR